MTTPGSGEDLEGVEKPVPKGATPGLIVVEWGTVSTRRGSGTGDAAPDSPPGAAARHQLLTGLVQRAGRPVASCRRTQRPPYSQAPCRDRRRSRRHSVARLRLTVRVDREHERIARRVADDRICRVGVAGEPAAL